MFWGLLGSTASARMCWCCNPPACHAPEEKMPTPGAHAARRNSNGMSAVKRDIWLITGGFRMVFILRQQVNLIHRLTAGSAPHNYIRQLAHSTPIAMALIGGNNQVARFHMRLFE